MSINRIILLGHIGQDPKITRTQNGMIVCHFSIATSEKFKDKNGQAQEKVEWHNCQCWDTLAENCEKYLKKGDTAFVEGKKQTRVYEDKKGQKQYTTEIICSRVEFLGKRDKGNENYEPPTQQNAVPWKTAVDPMDIPF